MVAEINSGAQIFCDAPLAQTPLILVLKDVFGKQLLVSKLCKKF